MSEPDIYNPLGIDYSGLNFAETLQRDEQAIQNRREYLNLRRAIDKWTLHTALNKKLRSDDLRDKFEVPEYFNVATDEPDKWRSLAADHGPVHIVRTVNKPANLSKWKEESKQREEAITNLVREKIEAEKKERENAPKDDFYELEIVLNDVQNLNDAIPMMRGDAVDPVVPEAPSWPKRNDPLCLTAFERNQNETALNKFVIAEKTKILAEHCEREKCERTKKKVVEKSIFEENGSYDTGVTANCGHVFTECDPYGFELNVGLEEGESRRYKVEGFRNPIRPNTHPKPDDDEIDAVRTCITRSEWFAEILPKRIRKVQRSRSLDRVDAAISGVAVTKASTREHRATQEAGDGHGRSAFSKPQRKDIAEYFGVDKSTVQTEAGAEETEAERPALKSLAADGYLDNNLIEPRNEITTVFKTRRHHIHRDHTKHKEAAVLYAPNRGTAKGKPATAKVPGEKVDRDLSWERAAVLYMPKRTSATVEGTDAEGGCPSSVTGSVGSVNRQVSWEEAAVLYFPADMDMTSGKPYRVVWHPTKMPPVDDAHNERMRLLAGSADIDRNVVISEIERMRASIAECASSESSEVCSNFTGGSGSEIYFDSQDPMPLRHLTKAYDPYEVLNRAGAKVYRLGDRKESEDAFYRVPYPGQLPDMRKLMSKKVGTKIRPTRKPRSRDTMSTFDRMNQFIYFPKTPLVDKKLDYLHELARVQFSYAIYDLNEREIRQLIQDLTDWNTLIEQTRQESLARDAELVNELFETKQKRNVLETKRIALRTELERIKLKITDNEQYMRQRMAYRKVIYLMMDREWRVKYDCLHTKEDGSLESFKESIGNRYKTHMRAVITNDAHGVMDFYENSYFPSMASRETADQGVSAEILEKAMNLLSMKPIILRSYFIWQLYERVTAAFCSSSCMNNVIENVLKKATAEDSNR